jgi:hypothetical protein
MTTVTNKQLLTLRSFNEMLAKTPDVADILPITHLSRLVKKFSSLYEEYDETLEDLRLDHCYKENNRIVRDEKGNFQWTAEGEKAFRKEYKVLLNKEVSLPEFASLSYASLSDAMGTDFAKNNPWDVMCEVLSPFYTN